ncbi:predicted protein [Uncinocarpus reesii 1704]|uniref:Uncharacterized protein n=1 Tax=Uncinocarpus reesii (strain UAMH 1704) TaxID=336963 RepID=C4JDF2_UNCRE|nr:uncharacterized protein UREG_00317 [Uncinocarpus reesii 1704]EEP75471.1 predicted protein [Uncinocarpus reesii 1704]
MILFSWNIPSGLLALVVGICYNHEPKSFLKQTFHQLEKAGIQEVRFSLGIITLIVGSTLGLSEQEESNSDVIKGMPALLLRSTTSWIRTSAPEGTRFLVWRVRPLRHSALDERIATILIQVVYPSKLQATVVPSESTSRYSDHQ